jgi:hypothetical protein
LRINSLSIFLTYKDVICILLAFNQPKKLQKLIMRM